MLLLATLLLLTQPASQPASLPDSDIFGILEEEEQVSTATRIAMKLSEAPDSVWVITQETIERSGAQNLAELLRMLPGVIVREITPGQTEMSLRFGYNFPNNQSLLLVDGRSVLIDAFGGSDLNVVPLQMIERVEVVIGPASTMYGANAYSGVINVITRHPTHVGTRSEVRLRSGIGYGSSGNPGDMQHGPGFVGMAFAEASHGWGSGGLKLAVEGDYLPSFLPVPNERGTVGDEPNRMLTGTAQVDQKIGRSELEVRLSGAAQRSLYALITDSPLDLQDYALSLTHRTVGLWRKDDQLLLQLWGRRVAVRHFEYFSQFAPVNLSFAQWSGELLAQYNLPELEHNRLSVGLQARAFWIDYAPITAGGTQQFVGLYVEDQYRPLPPLIITLGVRAEVAEGKGFSAFSRAALSPRLSVVWRINDDHTVRLEGSTAWRNPTPIENFVDLQNQDGVRFLVGSPTITREQIQSVILGYNGKLRWFHPRVELSMNRLDRAIIPNVVAATDAVTSIGGVPIGIPYYRGTKLPWVFANLSDAFWVPQALARLEVVPIPALKLWASYSFAPLGDFVGHFGSGGVEASWGWGSLFTIVYFLTQQPGGTIDVDMAGRVSLDSAVRIFADKEHRLAFKVAATNIVDYRYWVGGHTKPIVDRDYRSGERIGPRVFAELDYKWD